MYMCIFGYTHKFTDDKLKAYIFAKKVLLWGNFTQEIKKNVLKSELSRGSQQLVTETQKEIEQ